MFEWHSAFQATQEGAAMRERNKHKDRPMLLESPSAGKYQGFNYEFSLWG